MTREEEIKEAAKIRANQYEHPVDWNRCYHHYIQGAEWADSHPRKGLWDAEKVICWLRANFEQYAYNYGIDEVIGGLRKAMED